MGKRSGRNADVRSGLATVRSTPHEGSISVWHFARLFLEEL